MFGNRYFAGRYFGDRYFGPGSAGVAPPVTVRTGWAGPRRPRYVVYYRDPPEPVAAVKKPKRKQISREAVEAALDISGAGNWSLAEAMGALPKTVPVTFTPKPELSPFDVTVIAAAMWLADEAKRRAEAAQAEEDEIELLLLAA